MYIPSWDQENISSKPSDGSAWLTRSDGGNRLSIVVILAIKSYRKAEYQNFIVNGNCVKDKQEI